MASLSDDRNLHIVGEAYHLVHKTLAKDTIDSLADQSWGEKSGAHSEDAQNPQWRARGRCLLQDASLYMKIPRKIQVPFDSGPLFCRQRMKITLFSNEDGKAACMEEVRNTLAPPREHRSRRIVTDIDHNRVICPPATYGGRVGCKLCSIRLLETLFDFMGRLP